MKNIWNADFIISICKVSKLVEENLEIFSVTHIQWMENSALK